MKIRDFLNKDNWIKGHMARDRWGKPCGTFEPEACCWCIQGAVNVCYPAEERLEVFERIREHLTGAKLLGFFNDSATWEQVHELLVKADV